MKFSVAPDYAHRDKSCAPGALVRAGATRLKWYEIAYPEGVIEESVREAARAFAAGLDLTGDLGFVILHRCGGPGFYFLLAQTWRNENELWESVYARYGDALPEFAPYPQPGPHRGTFCVWELGAVWHEQQAWRRYLLSARDEAAKLAYLGDVYAGAV